MGWGTKGSKMFRIVAGVAVGGGTVAYLVKTKLKKEDNKVGYNGLSGTVNMTNTSPLGKVLASWTTNFKPTIAWDYNWDRRDPQSLVKPPKDGIETDDYKNELKKATPKASRHLIFIRHGQYNLEGDNDSTRMLTTLGHQQASITGQRLKNLNYPYTVLIHSSMKRAIETAEGINKLLPDLPTRQCDLLREGAPIPPEPPVGHWRPEPQQFFQDGARIEAAFRKYFYRADATQEKDSYDIIVCHANVIRYFVCRALQLPPEAWLRMSLYHGSLTWLTVRPSGRVALRYMGDAGFMDKDKLTTS